ncbi:hypothetical protein BDV93DRAFT_562413 [Ceratobasidium sp. AG-I]|nr:hypothetical protein BDV93DRAFT_562413 [Ceratobasidium sp. AG-I]
MDNTRYNQQSTGWSYSPAGQDSSYSTIRTQGDNTFDQPNSGSSVWSASNFVQGDYYAYESGASTPNQPVAQPAHYSPIQHTPTQRTSLHPSKQQAYQHIGQRSHYTQPLPLASEGHIERSRALFPPVAPYSDNLTPQITPHNRRASHPLNQFTPHQNTHTTHSLGHSGTSMDTAASTQRQMSVPVASQFANLALSHLSDNEHTATHHALPSARTTPHHVDSHPRASPRTANLKAIDSDSDMPDVADILRMASVVEPQQKDGGGSATQPSQPKPSSVAIAKPSAASKSAQKGKSKEKKKEDKTATSHWSFEEFENLVRHIVSSDALFTSARQKGAGLSFWNKISDELYKGEKKGESVRSQWKKAESLYAIVRAFESFTGGDGDGEWVVDDDDDEEAAIEKLNNRLAHIRQCKPNIDQHNDIKDAKMYRDWTRGGNDSLYHVMHQHFKDLKTFVRKATMRSGSISPGSDGDDEVTSKSDANDASCDSKSKPKPQARNTEKHTRSKNLADAVSTSADKIFAAKQESAKVKQESIKAKQEDARARHDLATQRLELDRAHLDLANKIALKTHQLQAESQKRKWSNDKRMAAMQEEEAKRRRTMEEKAVEEKHILERVQTLNDLISKTNNPDLIAKYQGQIDRAFESLP